MLSAVSVGAVGLSMLSSATAVVWSVFSFASDTVAWIVSDSGNVLFKLSVLFGSAGSGVAFPAVGGAFGLSAGVGIAALVSVIWVLFGVSVGELGVLGIFVPLTAALQINIIIDGTIIEENLKIMKKDNLWVENIIKKNGYNGVWEILLLTLDKAGNITIFPKDKSYTNNLFI